MTTVPGENIEAPAPVVTGVQAVVERDLESYGLAAGEARVLVALVRAGTADAGVLAEQGGLPRVEAGRILDRLAARGLAEPVPGEPGAWSSIGRDGTLNRLLDIEGERLRALRVRIEQTRRLLAELVVDAGPATPPGVRLLRGPALVEEAYEQLLAGAGQEVLVFNRPPYGFATTTVNQRVVEMLARAVDTRVLYRLAELTGPDAAAFRDETARYMTMGVAAGVVDDLPLKMAVVDRRVVLLTLVDAAGGDGFPTSLLVDDAGLAAALAAAFDRYWEGAGSVSALLDAP